MATPLPLLENPDENPETNAEWLAVQIMRSSANNEVRESILANRGLSAKAWMEVIQMVSKRMISAAVTWLTSRTSVAGCYTTRPLHASDCN
jgi:hypothetical protein